MNEDSNEKIQILLDKLENNTIKEEIIKTDNSPTSIVSETVNFIKQRFSKLAKELSFEETIKQAIIKKVVSEPIPLHELSSLLNQTKIRNTEEMEAILMFFKPIGDGGVSALDKFDKTIVSSTEQDVFDKASPEVLKALHQISSVLLEKEREDKENKKIKDD